MSVLEAPPGEGNYPRKRRYATTALRGDKEKERGKGQKERRRHKGKEQENERKRTSGRWRGAKRRGRRSSAVHWTKLPRELFLAHCCRCNEVAHSCNDNATIRTQRGGPCEDILTARHLSLPSSADWTDGYFSSPPTKADGRRGFSFATPLPGATQPVEGIRARDLYTGCWMLVRRSFGQGEKSAY
ncbi:hypothetical protein KM043_017893 [Ampulex compressa]|nr:hypothetical protein KM043_017893 [Ampulex compressa]